MLKQSHSRVFDTIAPIYGLFFQYQVRQFRKVIEANQSILFDEPYKILDIGCGTGALAYVLSAMGHTVTGIDGSDRMIQIARRLNRKNQATFQVADALVLFSPEGSPISCNQHYDLVVASHVLHGLPKEQRIELYSTMKHLATRRVVIMDYNQRRGLLTSAIEWLERGDYFNFIHVIEAEMKANFPIVKIIPTGKRSAWYICECGHA